MSLCRLSVSPNALFDSFRQAIYLALVLMFVWVPTRLVGTLFPAVMPVQVRGVVEGGVRIMYTVVKPLSANEDDGA